MWPTDLEYRCDLSAKLPWLSGLFQGRWFHLAVRLFGDGVFTFIILAGLFGPRDPDTNITLFLAWGLWWPSVVISWFLVGKMWCGFCPFPGLGRIFRRLGLCLNLPVPGWLRRHGVRLSVFGLALILWLEGATDITHAPRGTALLMLAILAGATLSGLLFEHKAWCMHLCPMGRIIGPAATISLTEFRPDRDLCRECRTFECKRGRDHLSGCPINLGAFNIRSSLSCHVCGYCVKLCQKNSLRLWLRSPFKELVRNKGKHLACSWVLPVLAGSQLLRFLEETAHPIGIVCGGAGWCFMSLYAAGLALGVAYVAGMIQIGDRAFGLDRDPILGRLSPTVPVVFPLAVTGELVYRLGYFLEWAPKAPAILGRHLKQGLFEGWLGRPGSGLNLPSRALDWAWVEAVFPSLELGLLLVGFAAGNYVLHRLATDEFPDLISPARRRLLLAVNMVMLGTYVGVLYGGSVVPLL